MSRARQKHAGTLPVIVAGCGYAGARLAVRQLARCNDVLALVSRESSRAKLAALGVSAAVWNLDTGDPAPTMVADEVVVYLVPPPPHGVEDHRLENFLRRLSALPARFVYVSTTGVYGDRDGATVDESATPAPHTSRARRRLAAETLVRGWCEQNAVPWVILRVPGIYGPDRLPLAALESGKPLLRPELAGPGNRIHVDDLVHCLIAGARTANCGRIYNLGDGDHASNAEFVLELARQCGKPPPRLAGLDEVRAAAGARRVDTTRMRVELGVEPVHDSMRSGIAASLAEMGLAG